ncbi:hypothetical protein PRBRB14_21850 [Hallella multisaccharivorax DSM 17128]|uniref:Uncharacterized protein n=1 Tax=Hallella multisaccharivorax DSM 17128 TaxID=688246 RepID=F8N7J2_9BACT|nr:hypothetical protein [Hallella multisaccharivorax]EGN57452.1 hypothetical protein Premu_2058 [Hallella multisaccharivorax DSM 17128]GJG31306.1 hypothetical protein PRBRB14_21850 [Hallella multisaccharivorax DSM 17128]
MEKFSFTIHTKDLKHALDLLSPFNKPHETEGKNPSLKDTGFYYGDKVSFVFDSGSVHLYILNGNSEFRVEYKISAHCDNNKLAFCIFVEDLQRVVDTFHCEILRFVEVELFGFRIVDGVTGEELSYIRAYSTLFQKDFLADDKDLFYNKVLNIHKHERTDLYQHVANLNIDKFKRTLELGIKFCSHSMFGIQEDIWYSIKNSMLTFYVNNFLILISERSPITAQANCCINMSCDIATRLLQAISCLRGTCFDLAYRQGRFCLSCKDETDSSFTLELSVSPGIPDISKICCIETVSNQATIKSRDVKFEISRAKELGLFKKADPSCPNNFIMHFSNGHVNFYWNNTEDRKTLYESFETI